MDDLYFNILTVRTEEEAEHDIAHLIYQHIWLEIVTLLLPVAAKQLKRLKLTSFNCTVQTEYKGTFQFIWSNSQPEAPLPEAEAPVPALPKRKKSHKNKQP